jgi:hypothetical protein
VIKTTAFYLALIHWKLSASAQLKAPFYIAHILLPEISCVGGHDMYVAFLWVFNIENNTEKFCFFMQYMENKIKTLNKLY